jgi:hypothetical protein
MLILERLRKEGCISPGDPVIQEKHCNNPPPLNKKNHKKFISWIL